MGGDDLVLTIDGGGSSFKAAVYSLRARRPIGIAVEEVAADYGGDGLAEFDTARWWGAVLTAIRSAVEAAARPASAYVGITCTGMRIPFVLVDETGAELAPGVLNVDRRGDRYLDRVRDALGPERLYRLTGHWPNAKLGLPKLLWYVDHQPELWRRVRRVLQFHDWLVFRLSGALASEPSSAAMSQLVDVERRVWADELLEAAGIDLRLLPELRDGGTEVGALRAEVAAEVGLAAGTPVHVGGGDTHVSSLGAGAAVDGVVAIVGGSTTPLMYASREPRAFADASSGPFVSPHARTGLWAFETNAGATGILYTWLRDLARGASVDGYAELDAHAAESPPGARGLVVAGANPAWGERGWERVPPTTLLGLTPGHSLGDLARGTLEGISYAVAANLEALEDALGGRVDSVVFTGGASRSAFASQLLADVLGRTVCAPAVAEPAALGGAALVAGDEALGEHEVVVYEPDDELHAQYTEAADRYREAYERLRSEFGS